MSLQLLGINSLITHPLLFSIMPSFLLYQHNLYIILQRKPQTFRPSTLKGNASNKQRVDTELAHMRAQVWLVVFFLFSEECITVRQSENSSLSLCAGAIDGQILH